MLLVFTQDPDILSRVRDAAGGHPVEWHHDGRLGALVEALLRQAPRALVVDAEAFAPLHPVTALLELRRLSRDLPLIVLLNGRRPSALRGAHVTYLGRPPASEGLRAALAPYAEPRAAGGRAP